MTYQSAYKLAIDENKLADLDFADDIVLFHETWSEMQQLLTKK